MAIDLQRSFFGDHNASYYSNDPAGFISAILPNVFIIAGLLLFLYLIFGGFTMISAGGDSKKFESGQQALTNAIIGFVIIFASYWIIQIISVITGIPILKSAQ